MSSTRVVLMQVVTVVKCPALRVFFLFFVIALEGQRPTMAKFAQKYNREALKSKALQEFNVSFFVPGRLRGMLRRPRPAFFPPLISLSRLQPAQLRLLEKQLRLLNFQSRLLNFQSRRLNFQSRRLKIQSRRLEAPFRRPRTESPGPFPSAASVGKGVRG